MLVAWLSSQPFSHKARSLLASVDARRRGSADDHSDENQKKPLQYSPWNGSFSFWYKNRLLTFSSIQKEGRVFREEEISVSCIGRSPDVLRELFSECRAGPRNTRVVFSARNPLPKRIPIVWATWDRKVQFVFINCRGLRPGYLYPQYLRCG